MALAGHADRVELIDEADRAAVLACRLAQRPEEHADLALGCSLKARLERGRSGEQERHARLRGEGLCGVGLSRAGATLEEQASARSAAHLTGEPGMAQEQLQRPDDL